jgi:hypothetical protein
MDDHNDLAPALSIPFQPAVTGSAIDCKLIYYIALEEICANRGPNPGHLERSRCAVAGTSRWIGHVRMLPGITPCPPQIGPPGAESSMPACGAARNPAASCAFTQKAGGSFGARATPPAARCPDLLPDVPRLGAVSARAHAGCPAPRITPCVRPESAGVVSRSNATVSGAARRADRGTVAARRGADRALDWLRQFARGRYTQV